VTVVCHYQASQSSSSTGVINNTPVNHSINRHFDFRSQAVSALFTHTLLTMPSYTSLLCWQASTTYLVGGCWNLLASAILQGQDDSSNSSGFLLWGAYCSCAESSHSLHPSYSYHISSSQWRLLDRSEHSIAEEHSDRSTQPLLTPFTGTYNLQQSIRHIHKMRPGGARGPASFTSIASITL